MSQKINPRSRFRRALCASLLMATGAANLSAEPSAPPAASIAAVTGKGWVGSWAGTLEVGPSTKLRLALEVTEIDGKLSAVLDSIDQNAKIPATAISAAGDQGTFACAAIGGLFEGRFSADGSEIAGTWSQGPNALPLTLKRQTAKS